MIEIVVSAQHYTHSHCNAGSRNAVERGMSADDRMKEQMAANQMLSRCSPFPFGIRKSK